MALVDHLVLSVNDGLVWVNAEYDDVTLDLVRVYGANDHPTRPYTFRIKRPNGRAWQERTLGPLESFEFSAGGPVKTIDDLNEWTVL